VGGFEWPSKVVSAAHLHAFSAKSRFPSSEPTSFSASLDRSAPRALNRRLWPCQKRSERASKIFAIDQTCLNSDTIEASAVDLQVFIVVLKLFLVSLCTLKCHLEANGQFESLPRRVEIDRTLTFSIKVGSPS
jgi:hypothetical protein